MVQLEQKESEQISSMILCGGMKAYHQWASMNTIMLCSYCAFATFQFDNQLSHVLTFSQFTFIFRKENPSELKLIGELGSITSQMWVLSQKLEIIISLGFSSCCIITVQMILLLCVFSVSSFPCEPLQGGLIAAARMWIARTCYYIKGIPPCKDNCRCKGL